MNYLKCRKPGEEFLLMGNDAIARGALEAGVSVAAGYPGTPSSEIVENLAKIAGDMEMYVEWSVNEKVAMEVAAAASFAGLRSLCTMKQNGVNVASDFLLHLGISGVRGGMVVIPCDDPGALSSINEGESRHFARLLELPLIEPGDFQEALEMTRWAFDLSEELRSVVMLRSVTRLSHASGNVRIGPLPDLKRRARFVYDGSLIDPLTGPVITMPVAIRHKGQQEKIKRAEAIFENSPFNTYEGPEQPELLIITSSACTLYSREAVHELGLRDRVGILKLGTTWPLPKRLLKKHLSTTGRILFVEEVLPFLEENIKAAAADMMGEIGLREFHGKVDGTLPGSGELNPDLVIEAIAKLTGTVYHAVPEEYARKGQILSFTTAPGRDLTFCPGCPHRASFWDIHNVLELDGRQGFVCGDIGCYTMAILPCGFSTLKTSHSMGSGSGLASGFGQLGRFGMDQPVLSVSGDSTFFHAVIPAMVNAAHHKSDIILVLLDNAGTAMTGFQSHPGLAVNAQGDPVPAVDIEAICRALGAHVETSDPFDVEGTEKKFLELIEGGGGARVMILRQTCALSPERKGKKRYEVRVDEEKCLGDSCGCDRICTRIFRCPALVWDKEKRKARIDEVLCAGCGVCASVCRNNAIVKEEVAR
ncbi:MAG: 4Fe-4S binding protein [Spirochaetes bacterium]|nr:4Fe-4S binding protein [Spirochaetota bacterium]